MKSLKSFNSFEINESYKENLERSKSKGYTPKYKPGYFIVLFIDVNSKENKYSINYTDNNRFLKKFGEEIGANILIEDNRIVEDGNEYNVYVTEPGKEFECMDKAKEYEFVVDVDLYDEKFYIINDLFEDLGNIVNENSYEYNMMSDLELSKLVDNMENIIKKIRKNI